MTPVEALRKLEAKLIPARTTAGSEAAWEGYRKAWLPAEDTQPANAGTTVALVHQGFSAGYDAAMAATRAALAAVQTEALRAGAVKAVVPDLGRLDG